MSRSIHTTRRELRELEASDYGTVERPRRALRRARDRLEQKRYIKAAVSRERRRGPVSHTSVDTIPVVVTEVGEFIHHAATTEDVRAVLRRLPPGVLDGLTRIELQSGAKECREWELEAPRGAKPDPLTRRLGYECFPDVFSARVLGVYLDRVAVVHLYAYVCRDDAPLGEVWRPMLRMQALSTLVHEVGHHYDDTMRVARGRWLARPGWYAERYAEELQERWLHSAVVPYLRAAYPEEMDRLEAWVEDHGLVRLSLEKLAKNAHIVEELARDVARGVPPSDRLLGFARNLESSDMLDEALRCLAAVLRDEPAHVGGLTLLVEMLGDRGRHGQAMFVAACVLALDEHNVEVLQVAARTLESLGGLHEARAAIDRILELEQFTEWHHEWALLQRASEAFRLGDVDAARSDAQLFRRELMSRLARRQLESLRAELAASDTSTTDDAHHP